MTEPSGSLFGYSHLLERLLHSIRSNSIFSACAQQWIYIDTFCPFSMESQPGYHQAIRDTWYSGNQCQGWQGGKNGNSNEVTHISGSNEQFQKSPRDHLCSGAIRSSVELLKESGGDGWWTPVVPAASDARLQSALIQLNIDSSARLCLCHQQGLPVENL